jgi:hypothetical protein
MSAFDPKRTFSALFGGNGLKLVANWRREPNHRLFGSVDGLFRHCRNDAIRAVSAQHTGSKSRHNLWPLWRLFRLVRDLVWQKSNRRRD